MRSFISEKLTKLPWWAYWIFFIFVGLVILVVEDNYDHSDTYAITVVTYFALLFSLLLRWAFRQIRKTIKVKNQKTKNELIHLQSQVNPHFFFNTLNNLYGWVEKDPKQAQKMILKLSDMMRYSIYDGQEEEVTLEQEIEFIKNYIELHKMRYLKKIDVVLKEEIDNPQIKIRPLLFIILLENAFKHGVETLRSDAFVHIDCTLKKDKLSFVIKNNFETVKKENNQGIGLNNLRRRLELVYPKKHKLSITTEDNIYNATLNITLNG